MSGTYEHVIRLEIDASVPSIPNVLGIDKIVEDDILKIRKQLLFQGNTLLNKLGHTSQTLQQHTIQALNAVDTGRLLRSVRMTGGANEVRIGTSLYYAKYVHDGHGATVHKTDWHGNVRHYGSAEPRPWSDISWEQFEPTIDSAVKSWLSSISF